jgi:hypothetical protein
MAKPVGQICPRAEPPLSKGKRVTSYADLQTLSFLDCPLINDVFTVQSVKANS